MRYAIALCAMLLVLSSCKKKEAAVTVTSNAWQTISPFGSSYIFYNSDGTTTQYTNFLYGIHTKSTGHYNTTNNQIEYSDGGSSTSFGNYHISGDTLYIEKGSSTIIYTKANPMPDTANWIRNIQVIEKFPIATRSIGGLDYDGTYIVMRGTNGKVFRISTTTHQLVDSVSPPFNGRALACIGSNLWLSNSAGTRFDQLDFATNTSVASSPATTAIPAFACADATKIYFMDADGNFKTYTPSGATFASLGSYAFLSSGFGGAMFDLHQSNGKIYASGFFGLLELDPVNSKVTNTYTGVVIVGMTEVAGQLWGIGFDSNDAYTLGVNAQPYMIHFSLN